MLTTARVPSAVKIVDVTGSMDPEQRFVVTNEATGRHFSANEATANFIEALREAGTVHEATKKAGLSPIHAANLMDQLAKQGIVAWTDNSDGRTEPRGPIEGKLVSLRADLANAAGLARRLSWFGSLMFSIPVALLSAALALYGLAILASNSDKIRASLLNLAELDVGSILPAAGLFIGLKVAHELGHVMAYRIMCLREGYDPGPIRVGLMIFAGTPFPFTDVTGAWRLRSRWRRALIGAAGIYFELVTVGVLVLAWEHLDLGWFETTILQVAVFSGAMTLLFNLNPAVKLDGYYILTDLLGQPNLAGRASQAARTWVGRQLGADLPKPKEYELAYWVIAYLYRWSIFVGVFWIAYRLDPRLGSVVAAISGMLLIVRPIIATSRSLQTRIKHWRLGFGFVMLGALLGLLFVPFQSRLILDGQIYTHRTSYFWAPETAIVAQTGGVSAPIVFEQPGLKQQKLELETRLSILQSLARTPGLSATEQAGLMSDGAGLEKQLFEVNSRLARLEPKVHATATFVPIASESLSGAWVRSDYPEPLAALATPVPAFVTVRMEQWRLEYHLSPSFRVRMTNDPTCEFDARFSDEWSETTARDGIIELDASPSKNLPVCARASRNGAAIVARLPLPPRSVIQKIGLRMDRLLQERLPFEAKQ